MKLLTTHATLLWVLILVLFLFAVPLPSYRENRQPCPERAIYEPKPGDSGENSLGKYSNPCSPRRIAWVWSKPLVMLWIEQFFGVSLPTREASAEPVKYFEPTHDDEEDEGELDDEVSSEQDDSEDTDEDNESDSQNVNFVCPQTEWIDCMPGPDKSMDYMGMYCSQDYLKWAQENCPGFEGAAY